MPNVTRYGLEYPHPVAYPGSGNRMPPYFLTREAAEREANGRDGVTVYETTVQRTSTGLDLDWRKGHR